MQLVIVVVVAEVVAVLAAGTMALVMAVMADMAATMNIINVTVFVVLRLACAYDVERYVCVALKVPCGIQYL